MTMLSAEQLDGIVDAAREICKRSTPLPDRSAVQTLARFAHGTDSTKEVELFVRYQAARARSQERFYVATADHIASSGYGILALRRFLGVLVRAAHVQRQVRS